MAAASMAPCVRLPRVCLPGSTVCCTYLQRRGSAMHGQTHNSVQDNDTEDDGAGDTPMDLPDSCPASGGFPLVTDEHAMSPSGPSGSAGSPGQVPITCAAGQQLEPRMDHTTHSELGDKGPVSPAQNMSSSTTGAQRLRSSCLGKRSLNAERPVRGACNRNLSVLCTLHCSWSVSVRHAVSVAVEPVQTGFYIARLLAHPAVL